MSIKDIVRELCKANNITAQKLEKECGFANGFISKLDKSTPNAKNIEKIANYFDVSVDVIMGRTTESVGEYCQTKETTEIMQELFESPGRRALFKAVSNMTEEEVQRYADFIEGITNGNNKNN